VATKLFPIVPVDPVVGRRARGSLRRLGIDTLDLYQVHWPNPVVPLALTMPALGRVQREGLTRHVGVSNFSLAKWKEAETALGGPVLSNQVRYSLVDRRPEKDLLPWAQANGRIVIAYSPLSQGLLSGRYDAARRPGGLRASTPAFLPENLERFEPLLAVLRAVAAAHQASCAQVALAWLLRRPNVVVIPGASSVEQAEANAAAADIELADDEDAALSAASDAYDPVTGVAALPALARVRAQRVLHRVGRVAGGLKA
jgi:aryl-alcohol dehydrogenase-like predicted oxidoreductase